MTELLYLRDAYLDTFHAVVTAVDGQHVGTTPMGRAMLAMSSTGFASSTQPAIKLAMEPTPGAT